MTRKDKELKNLKSSPRHYSKLIERISIPGFEYVVCRNGSRVKLSSPKEVVDYIADGDLLVSYVISDNLIYVLPILFSHNTFFMVEYNEATRSLIYSMFKGIDLPIYVSQAWPTFNLDQACA